jgi:hypothetical protein
MFRSGLLALCCLLLTASAFAKKGDRRAELVQMLRERTSNVRPTHPLRERIVANVEASQRARAVSGMGKHLVTEKTLRESNLPWTRRFGLAASRLWRGLRRQQDDKAESRIESSPRRAELLSIQRRKLAEDRQKLDMAGVVDNVEFGASIRVGVSYGSPNRYSTSRVRLDAAQFLGERFAKLNPKVVSVEVDRVRNRRASLAIQETYGQFSAYDLRWVEHQYSRKHREDVRIALAEIETHPVESWMPRLASLANKTRGWNGSRYNVYGAIWWKIVRQFGESHKTNENVIRREYLQQKGAELLRHKYGRALEQILPRNLPPLPRANGRFLRRLLGEAKKLDGRQKQLLFLEERLVKLRASGSEDRRKNAEELGKYLSVYKGTWIDKMVNYRFRKFARKPAVLDWNLKANLRFVNQGRRKMTQKGYVQTRQRLDEAWAILLRVVHPQILARLPEVTVVVESDRKRASHNETTIRLSPDSTVATILHEFGHHIEDHSGARIFGAVHALRTELAFNREAPRKLNELVPKGNYRDNEKAYPGAFASPYQGKIYEKGYTEILSMGLENFADKAGLRRFLLEDGQYALLTMAAIQNYL